MLPITTDKAPSPAGPYSQGVRSGDFIFTSGQLPIDHITGKMPDSIEKQVKVVLSNVSAILAAGGAKHVISVTIYLTDMDNFQIMNSVYTDFLKSPYPARTCVGVKTLPKGALIMADAVGSVE